MNTTQLNKVSSNGPAFAAMLESASVKKQFENALGKYKDTFIASLVDLYKSEASLQACDSKALVSEALRAAVLHLPLTKSLGFAYIVPFKGKPNFILGYKGYIQLALRSGQYRTINADCVYEGELLATNKLTGEISFDGDKTSDKIVGYFAHIELTNGFRKTLYMTLDEMAAYAKRFVKTIPSSVSADDLKKKANDAAASTAVGWMGNFNDMALKTVMRRLLSKYGYLSVEMINGLSSETDEGESRDGVIAERANRVVIAEDVAYENLDDKKTPEPETESPGY